MQTKQYNFVLFTTCDAKGGRIDEVSRLLDTVNQAIQDHGLKIKHYILMQQAESIPEMLQANEGTEFMTSNTRLSLSRARNIMLNKATKDATLENAEICAFPDDDAWYANGFLSAVRNHLMNAPDISFFSCRYGSTPPEVSDISDLDIMEAAPSLGTFIRSVSSVTLFLKTDIAIKNAFFDERLGVGAEINGGEDLDYALRAYTHAGGRMSMSPSKLVGHRDRPKLVRSTYFKGSLFAISRNARINKAAFLQMIRKVLVGIYFMLSGELKPSHYLAGLTTGIKGFFKQKLQVNTFD